MCPTGFSRATRRYGPPGSALEALWAYAVVTTRQTGAHHPPLHFVSAALFSADIKTLYKSVRCPLWVSMATCGDFTDYQDRSTLADHANRPFHRVVCGALPYFEDLHDFVSPLESFWRAASR